MTMQDINNNGHHREGVHGNPEDIFRKHFESVGGGIGPAEELLKTGKDFTDLIVRGRIPKDKVPALMRLCLKAELAERDKIQPNEFYRLAAAYYIALTIGEGGGARREFLFGLTRSEDNEERINKKLRNGFFNRNRK